jgi:hypothetical protein
MALTADFEKGTLGATIGPGDAGSGSTWDNTGVGGAGSSLVYDATHVAHGSKAAKMVNATSGATTMVYGAPGQFGTPIDHFGRWYLYVPSTTVSSFNFLCPLASGVSQSYAIQLLCAVGQIGVGGVSKGPMPFDQMFRLEAHWFQDASAGFVEIRLYSTDIDSDLPDWNVVVNSNQAGTANEFDIGNRGSGGIAYTVWVDQSVVAADAWPGSFPSNTVAPTVSGTGIIGGSCFCDGGEWNGGAQFALTYQWFRSGSLISGATSSSYVLQSADNFAAITCTVTARGIVATNEIAIMDSSNSIVTGGAIIASKSLGVKTGGNIIYI